MQFEEKKCSCCGRIYREEADYLNKTSRWRVCDQGNLWFNCSCNSTILIPKGKFPWYSPQKVMRPEAASIFNKIPNIGELPHLPTSVAKLQAVLSDPNASSSQIANVLKENAFIASDILKTANQMKSQRSQNIESLEHAMTYIGRKTVSDLAAIASFKTFPFKTKKFTADDYWQHALLNAKIAELIAVRFSRHLSPDQVFLAGSLCNLGKLVYAICNPESVDNVQEIATNPDTQADWRSIEKSKNIFDHSILGEIACALWGLPDFVRDSCVDHHKPPSKEKSQSLSDVVGLANQITHWVLLEPARIDSSLLNLHREKMGLDQRTLERFIDEITAALDPDAL